MYFNERGVSNVVLLFLPPSGSPFAAAQSEEAAEQGTAHPHPRPGQCWQDHGAEDPGLGTGRNNEHHSNPGTPRRSYIRRA